MRSAREVADCARIDPGAAANKTERQNATASWQMRLLLCKVNPPKKNGWDSCALLRTAESLAGMQIFKLDVQDRVFVPVFVIEVPPLVFINSEAFRFHSATEQVAVPALERGAAWIIGEGARRHLIVRAWHFDGLAGG